MSLLKYFSYMTKNNPSFPSSLLVVLPTSLPSLPSAELEATNAYTGKVWNSKYNCCQSCKVKSIYCWRKGCNREVCGSKRFISCGEIFLREVKMQICMAPIIYIYIYMYV